VGRNSRNAGEDGKVTGRGEGGGGAGDSWVRQYRGRWGLVGVMWECKGS